MVEQKTIRRSHTREINDGMASAFVYDLLIVDLLDTPEVQRTAHVRQNGVNYSVFPSLAA